ncbi:MAG: tRNA (guanosine(46)-N7)-methyltransferase TrmB [Alphaproteobacteria bacterium]|nr:tRNA (guanosine(46)-N7)-methyltransferase TrmB [Alphaproteobacteria bacterium]
MEKQELIHLEQNELRSFGRRHGKKLSKRKKYLVDFILPTLAPIFTKKSQKPTILEIGFGNGEHLLELSLNNPDNIIIGAEPFINGVASLLSAITSETDNSIKKDFSNIKIYPDDVRLLLHDKNCENTKFAQIWILHPDPWPKARHEKRRLLNSDFLNLLSNHLDTNGNIIIGTDHWEYYEWIQEQVKTTNLKIKSTDLETIHTRYQLKNKACTSTPKYMILSKN